MGLFCSVFCRMAGSTPNLSTTHPPKSWPSSDFVVLCPLGKAITLSGNHCSNTMTCLLLSSSYHSFAEQIFTKYLLCIRRLVPSESKTNKRKKGGKWSYSPRANKTCMGRGRKGKTGRTENK